MLGPCIGSPAIGCAPAGNSVLGSPGGGNVASTIVALTTMVNLPLAVIPTVVAAVTVTWPAAAFDVVYVPPGPTLPGAALSTLHVTRSVTSCTVPFEN